jgi:hypothetical protein
MVVTAVSEKSPQRISSISGRFQFCFVGSRNKTPAAQCSCQWEVADLLLRVTVTNNLRVTPVVEMGDAIKIFELTISLR